jgi:hypothetical protein
MHDERTAQAVYNNAVWCDTVSRAHGSPGEFLETIWLNRRETPRFYPNAVTLSEAESSAQLNQIRDLIEADLPGEWGVKDSFHALDLTPLGFRVLPSAEWIYRAASLPAPEVNLTSVRWARIDEATELAAWEAAWNGEPDTREAPQPRIFLPSLLEDANVAFFAAYNQQRIVAGAIANRTGDVVGISNIFLPEHDATHFRAACLASVMDAFPGLPLVGYESDNDLAEMRSLGFESVGPLRIWLKTTQ